MKGYPSSINAYSHVCDEILSWMNDWLSQNEFDRLSSQSDVWNKKIIAYDMESIVMPMYGDNNLAILQQMQLHGLVEAKLDGRLIHYRSTQEKAGAP